MATSKVKIFYDLVQNKVRDSKMYGKWYAEPVVLQTLNMRGLAKHIVAHGSPFTLDTIMAVLTKAGTCIVELISEGKAVKVEGLGKFYPTLQNKKGGAAVKEDFDESKIEGVHVRFLPEGSNETGDDITSASFRKKVSLERRGWVEGTGKGRKVHLFFETEQQDNG